MSIHPLGELSPNISNFTYLTGGGGFDQKWGVVKESEDRRRDLASCEGLSQRVQIGGGTWPAVKDCQRECR
jgi:hypothetical protein